MSEFTENQKNLVEAIENGKIVRVSEEYAKHEGLYIIKSLRSIEIERQLSSPYSNRHKKIDREEPRLVLDNLKRTRSWKESQVTSELVENFNWRIAAERRKKGLTRKQLARLLNENEGTVKMLEYGSLPMKDFVIINKVQEVLGINLRKDGKNFNAPIKDLFNSEKSEIEEKDEIEILDEE